MSRGPDLPSIATLVEIAGDFGIALTADDAEAYRAAMSGAIGSYRRVEAMAEPKLPVKYQRDAGWRPSEAENPLNAWYWRCVIEGAASGPLKGERIGIKDAICVAGIPMMNGSRLLEGYIPDVDATIVTRLLDAGATIVGKTNTEDCSFSGSGHLCAHGPVRNPRKPTHNPGASSCGSAAALGAGEIDLALGGDQGGSIRIPASWSGVYGLKPSYGLVPYTGCAMIEHTMDHVGPMANSSEGIARLLSVIAGPDPLDPRQRGVFPPGLSTDYLPALKAGVKGMRIALVKEAFALPHVEGGPPASDPVVDARVRDAAERLRGLGAEVDEVSVPAHLDGMHVYVAIMMEGATEFMIKAGGAGTNWAGWYNTQLAEACARGLKARPHDVPPTVLSVLLTGEYMRRAYFGRYYCKGQNLRGAIAAGYDAVLKDYHLLAMPATPIRATPIPPRDISITENLQTAFSMLRNTCVADVTGHPSLSLPCGMEDGLPIGLMLTGRRFDDATVIAASAAFEAAGDWTRM
jgi:amidase